MQGESSALRPEPPNRGTTLMMVPKTNNVWAAHFSPLKTLYSLGVTGDISKHHNF